MSYAKEVQTKYPFIELHSTGGGCDCFAMQAADGGWFILAADCVAPESAEESEGVVLVKYPYDADGWGADGECGEVILENVPASECIEYMASAQRDPSGKNQYYCFWGEGYPAISQRDDSDRIKDKWFFSEANGFTNYESVQIKKLEIGQAYTIDSGFADQHITVVRAR